MMDRDLLLRMLAEKGVDLSPDMVLRGMPAPMQREPMIPSGPVGSPLLAQEAEAPAAPPMGRSFMDKLRGGVAVPTTPIRHKNVNSRSFLRGLVGGFKASGDSPEGGDRGSRSGGTAGRQVRDYSAQDDAARALAEMRRARVAEINEPDPTKEMTPEELAWWNARTEKEKAYAARAMRPPVARGGGSRKGGSEGGGLTDAEKRARLKILMAPWEKQAAAMMGSRPVNKKGKTDKKAQPIGATSGPEIQGWLDSIRRTYAQKLGLDLGIGGAAAPPTIAEPSADPYDAFLNETDEE